MGPLSRANFNSTLVERSGAEITSRGRAIFVRLRIERDSPDPKSCPRQAGEVNLWRLAPALGREPNGSLHGSSWAARADSSSASAMPWASLSALSRAPCEKTRTQHRNFCLCCWVSGAGGSNICFCSLSYILYRWRHGGRTIAGRCALAHSSASILVLDFVDGWMLHLSIA
ncbi:hypothetical protein K491DRAFT_210295 [Lophiostoma macrostomum CBS 122681]|uniref:Uncharacterized protein n=1 Tax=Lophiostoma macrostomum CBS 122681 TaxID=1314788 RepID=A0A6A6SNL0_9PLEO|nr:hypothetical protein K491DRAFT_210295 [Lophiostoma macrostomum CBS 122681]